MAEDKSDIQKRLEAMSGNQGQIQNPVRIDIGNQLNSKRPKSKIGCFSVLIPLVIIGLILLYFLFNNLIIPLFSPNAISGNFMDYTYIPETGKLWIITDGSFHYTSKTTTGGSYSIKSKGLFCKTWTYVFDPLKNAVDNKIKTEYDDLPPTYKLFYNDGKIWKVCSQNSGYDAEVYVYDAKTQAELYNTAGFTAKYKLLNSGLSNLRMEFNPLSIQFDTKDGRNPVYLIDADTIFVSQSDANKYSNSKVESYSDFAVGNDEQGNSRFKVYYITGPESKVKSSMSMFSYSPNTMTYKSEINATDLLPDKIFIEAVKLFSNSECCIIFHQDQAGDNSNRLLSCVNSDGSLFWTKKQSELFDDLEGRKDKSFSSMFFIKGNVSAQKSGDIVIFKYKDGGLIGFDYKTGKEMWRIKI
ncbi:MAG: hypothetical protein ACOYN6_11595 [Ignavibacteria bacterium]